jgi:two-component system response regulator NreC
VEDHAIVRAGVRLLLQAEPDIEVLGEAGDGYEGIAQTEALTPDVVLMDLSMPGISGLEAAREIKRRWPQVQVLALTVHRSDDYFFRMLEAGASGYVLKGADPADLLAAVRAAQRGYVFLYPAMAERLVADYLRRVEAGEGRASYDGLSDREREVLRLIAEGQSTAEIAQALFLSPHTVQSHRRAIMEKLNLHNRVELVRYALRRGLIED